jgi:hypothetical protein
MALKNGNRRFLLKNLRAAFMKALSINTTFSQIRLLESSFKEEFLCTSMLAPLTPRFASKNYVCIVLLYTV